MFRWYSQARICYVYLADVMVDAQLEKSRWFTRGWTLQELIAPSTIEFYTAAWTPLGSKRDLAPKIGALTKIPNSILSGKLDLHSLSVAQRMSWAAKRNTTRPEDIAYCLMGIFDINMPLIYGEGKKAFRRLQEEIMKTTRDPSLFAWGSRVFCNPYNLDVASNDGKLPGSVTVADCYSSDDLPWHPPADRPPLFGLLAQSPSAFEAAGSYQVWSHYFEAFSTYQQAPIMLRDGCLVNLPVIDVKLDQPQFFGMRPTSLDSAGDQLQVAQLRKWKVAILLCEDTNSSIEGDYTSVLGIPLQAWGAGGNTFARTWEILTLRVYTLPFSGGISLHGLKTTSSLIHVGQPRPFSLDSRSNCMVFRRLIVPEEPELVAMTRHSGALWRQGDSIVVFPRIMRSRSFTVVFRLKLGPKPSDRLLVAFTWEARTGNRLEVGFLEESEAGWIGQEENDQDLFQRFEATYRRMVGRKDTCILKSGSLPAIRIHSTREHHYDQNTARHTMKQAVDIVDVIALTHPSFPERQNE